MARKRDIWLSGHEDLPEGEPDRRSLDGGGYVILTWYRPEATYRGREHRLVTRARPDQHVHHVNGAKSDNREENLQVVDSHAVHMELHGASGTWRALEDRICPHCGDRFRPLAARWNVTCRKKGCVDKQHASDAKKATEARWRDHVKMTPEERVEAMRASRRKYKDRKLAEKRSNALR